MILDDQALSGPQAPAAALEDLDLRLLRPVVGGPHCGDDCDPRDDRASETDADEGDDGAPAGGDMERRGEESEEGSDEEQASDELDLGEQEGAPDDDASDSSQSAAGRRNWELSPPTDYKAFTTRFDEIVGPEDLCDLEELGRLRAYLDQQMASSQSVVTRLANRLQRRLMAQQSRSWEFEPGRGAARRRRGSGDRQSRPFAQLQVERDTEFREPSSVC